MEASLERVTVGLSGDRRGPLPLCHALVTGKIAVGAYVTEAALDKLASDSRGLSGAVLQQQPAARLEVRRCGLDDGAQAREGIRRRGRRERTARLEAER